MGLDGFPGTVVALLKSRNEKQKEDSLMSPNHFLKFIAFFMSLFLGGCVANFEPRMSSPGSLGSGLPTVSQVKAGLEVSLEEFVSANKSRRAFDADIASKGVLPLLLRVENNGAREYKVLGLTRRQPALYMGGKQRWSKSNPAGCTPGRSATGRRKGLASPTVLRS